MADPNGEVLDDGADEGPIVLPEGASCATCAYSALVQPEPNAIQRVRVCRRMPPAPLVIPTPGPDGRPVLQITAQNPIVADQYFCYEWDQAVATLIPTGLG